MTPVSPVIFRTWLNGATRLHVNRATTPDSKVMQATEKSGVVMFRRSSAEICLSGHSTAEKGVIVLAGPKKAVKRLR